MLVNKPSAMMLIGTGVRAYEAGEVWHLLDQRVGMPITKFQSETLIIFQWINTMYLY